MGLFGPSKKEIEEANNRAIRANNRVGQLVSLLLKVTDKKTLNRKVVIGGMPYEWIWMRDGFNFTDEMTIQQLLEHIDP